MESKLKAVRAGHKSAVTRLLRKTEEEQDLEIEESTELLETLSQKQKIISALNEEILNLTKDEDVEDEILQTDEYKFFLNTKIRHIRKKYSNSPTSNITTLPNLSNQSTENTNQHSSRTDHVIEFHENRRDNRINIRVGDIVQVYDEKPRTRWKKQFSQIVKLYPLEINKEDLPNTADETNEVDTRRTVPMPVCEKHLKTYTNS
ncbi:unnamed protein product [Mytilus edulis]|uniref:Uncharacterized protein n=1 Tax=Mytilus edulis TaxID=6550 RepID=A0A8S3T124_MYTED|nr:unnamed protein product [Mytilus edulis]